MINLHLVSIDIIHMKEYSSDQYSDQRYHKVAIKYPWLMSRQWLTLIFKWLTPATVTGCQSLYETQIFYTSHDYGKSVLVRDFSYCTRLHYIYRLSNAAIWMKNVIALYSYLSQIWRRRSPWQRNARPAAIQQSTPTYLWCLVMDYWGCNLKFDFPLTRSICWLVNLLLEVKLLFTYQSQ